MGGRLTKRRRSRILEKGREGVHIVPAFFCCSSFVIFKGYMVIKGVKTGEKRNQNRTLTAGNRLLGLVIDYQGVLGVIWAFWGAGEDEGTHSADLGAKTLLRREWNPNPKMASVQWFSVSSPKAPIDMAARDGELRVFLVTGEVYGDFIASLPHGFAPNSIPFPSSLCWQ
ncbi:hypothetical protein Fmac_001534 [Flemingia macrophylla]|uniref:Uncharacterized protein n=1 Tax=Flemingia macrophylla TaxID=520843 RepID=A0ABD1NHE3_9FABA